MLRTYLKIAWRGLLNKKSYALINIGGLAVGLATAILIGLWIYDEVSFNRSHKHYKTIAQVMLNQTFDGEVSTGTGQALQLGPELNGKYGNNFNYVVMSSGTRGSVLSTGTNPATKTGRFMGDEAPELLSLDMLSGSRNGLKDINSILLSESTAKILFGEKSPEGEIVRINNKADLEVTGIYKDIPENSSFADLDFIAPWNFMVKDEELADRVGWGNNWFLAYVQLADHADMGSVSKAIAAIKRENIVQEDADRIKPELFLHPMSDWHLYSKFENGISVGGRIEFVWLFGTIGVFVLFLACINFMNLSTARSEKRAKEVGIRKVVGSFRSQLISQFFSESLVVTFLALFCSVFLVYLSLPWFNEVSGKSILLPWNNWLFWVVIVGFTVLTGLIAGSLPAFYFSSFKPISVLKGTFKVGKFAALPRKALVIIQFTVSITLIIGTIIVYQQIQFAKNRPVGYGKEGLVSIPIKTAAVKDQFEAIRNDLIATGMVNEAALSQSSITNTWTTNSGFDWRGKDPGMQDVVITAAISHEFGKVVDWQIVEGRDFSRDFASDSSGFILNQAAVEYMGFEDPIGETIKAFDRSYTVIGVVENMVTQSLYEPVKQAAFYIDSFNRTRLINVKINPDVSVTEALAEIGEVFKKHDPSVPFEYSLADDEFAAKYLFEERIGKLTGFFAVLALLISCLGLFGLASFIAEKRTKELGIRKVLGASISSLWRMLSYEFVLLVVISCLIAIPVSYSYLRGWLDQFEYRVPLYWWVFGVAGLGAMVITLLTVSFQSIKAALMNPVESLKSE
ncbi:ABC transporter permease [Algoriphagus resistens]|uniref:ABC transporter permease n=1 Tax=Algoriphagus resistens TaxID=1750590 RepID=UPI000716B4C2|nr:ABC transporter permease [Algoriphagus resistens]